MDRQTTEEKHKKLLRIQPDAQIPDNWRNTNKIQSFVSYPLAPVQLATIQKQGNAELVT